MRLACLYLAILLLVNVEPVFSVETKPSLAPAKPASASRAVANSTNKRVYRERIKDGDLEYDVIVTPDDESQVSVVPLNEGARRSSPKLHFYSEDDRERELSSVPLRTIEPPDAGGPRYAGKLDRWNDNYIGFVLTVPTGDPNAKPRELKRDFRPTRADIQR